MIRPRRKSFIVCGGDDDKPVKGWNGGGGEGVGEGRRLDVGM